MNASVELRLSHHCYPIHIGSGLLSQLGTHVRHAAPHDRCLLYTDAHVDPLFGHAASDALDAGGYQVVRHVAAASESHKTLDAVRAGYDVMVAHKLERRSPVIALGGGVVGDTAGFVAATYLRGVPFIQCPTTLLAMVDASVGGKVGVNLPQGKNLVGAFHQPNLVLIDTDTLATLPVRERRCGLAECVKHGVIRDESLFDWIDQHAGDIEALDPATMVELVHRNVRIKAAVVMADEKETGERAHLNLGHTFAHAIEATTGYGQGAASYHHGEAVSLGMVAAARLAAAVDLCDPSVPDRLVALLAKLQLPTSAPGPGPGPASGPASGPGLPPTHTLMDAMRLDKKIKDAKLRLILPTRIGQVVIRNNIADAQIAAAWDSLR
jgi:3-dehydroquinate synthase